MSIAEIKLLLQKVKRDENRKRIYKKIRMSNIHLTNKSFKDS